MLVLRISCTDMYLFTFRSILPGKSVWVKVRNAGNRMKGSERSTFFVQFWPAVQTIRVSTFETITKVYLVLAVWVSEGTEGAATSASVGHSRRSISSILVSIKYFSTLNIGGFVVSVRSGRSGLQPAFTTRWAHSAIVSKCTIGETWRGGSYPAGQALATALTARNVILLCNLSCHLSMQ